jgi:hypothetical protein
VSPPPPKPWEALSTEYEKVSGLKPMCVLILAHRSPFCRAMCTKYPAVPVFAMDESVKILRPVLGCSA